ncbi:MAG: hypothetical protein ACRENE_01360 [Polyangiaceae bacterium]
MSLRLDAYLELERAMMALDDADDPMADRLRDALDPIWYSLTDEEHAFLNRRSIAPGPAYAIRVAVDAGLFTTNFDEAGNGGVLQTLSAPIVVDDWKCAA